MTPVEYFSALIYLSPSSGDRDPILSSGYVTKFSVLNARDYGLPQSRPRLIIVGVQMKHLQQQFEFPVREDLQLQVWIR